MLDDELIGALEREGELLSERNRWASAGEVRACASRLRNALREHQVAQNQVDHYGKLTRSSEGVLADTTSLGLAQVVLQYERALVNQARELGKAILETPFSRRTEPALWDRLEARAAREGVSPNVLAVQLLEAALDAVE